MIGFRLFSGMIMLCAMLGSHAMPALAADGFTLGVGVHLSGGRRDIVRSLNLLQAAGGKSIRDDATWALVEQEKGVLKIPAQWEVLVDEAGKRGIEVLWILDYGNRYYDGGAKPFSDAGRAAFARYAGFVAAHIKGRVSRYEIWNEWEHTTGRTQPETPEAYAALVRTTVPAIKRADPSAEVIVGAVGAKGIRGGYLQRVIELGVLDHADALSVHTYIHCRRLWYSKPSAWADWMRSLHGDLARWVGRPMDFYITEIGWPSNEGVCGINEERQAEYLAQMFELAKGMPFIRGIWWYDFQNDGSNRKEREHNFGLVDEGYNPKPAYRALKENRH